MSDTPATPDEPPPAASKGPMTLILAGLCVLNLAGTGFVAMKVVKLGKLAAGDAHGEAPSAVTATAAFEPFVVNLNEPGSNRYLKTSFEVELGSEQAAELLNKDKRAVRDDILRYLSGLSLTETIEKQDKTKIQEQIVARVDKLVGPGGVRHLYFVDFVIQ